MKRINTIVLIHLLGILQLVTGCADGQSDDPGVEVPMGQTAPANEVPAGNPSVPGKGDGVPVPIPNPVPAPVPLPPVPAPPRILKILNGEKIPKLDNRDISSIVLPFAMKSGGVLKITPVTFAVEAFRQDDPVSQRTDHPACVEQKTVCTTEEPIFERRCSSHSYPCVKCDWLGCRPWVCSEDVCSNVQIGTRCTATSQVCARSENQWVDEAQYSAPVSKGMVKQDFAVLDTDLFLVGMKLLITPNRPDSSPIECVFKDLPWHHDGSNIEVPVQSTPNCNLNAVSETEDLGIVIENAVTSELTFKSGSEVRNWKGDVVTPAQSVKVKPRVEFQGIIEGV